MIEFFAIFEFKKKKITICSAEKKLSIEPLILFAQGQMYLYKSKIKIYTIYHLPNC